MQSWILIGKSFLYHNDKTFFFFLQTQSNQICFKYASILYSMTKKEKKKKSCPKFKFSLEKLIKSVSLISKVSDGQ